jgi:D-lactate dehydrogenase
LEEEGFVKDEVHMLAQGHPNEDQLKTILADHELMYMDNVIITPHNAFNSKEALQRILDTTIMNIQGFAAGKPANLVKG